MSEDYNGNNRRKSTNDIAHVLGKLETFMETSEKNQTIMVKSIDDKLVSFKEIMTIQFDRFSDDITQLEEKGSIVIKSHNEDNKKDHKGLTEGLNRIYKGLSDKIDRVDERVDGVDTKLKDHGERIEVLEDKPMMSKANQVDKFWNIFLKMVYTAMAAGIIGLAWKIFEYVT